MGTDPEVLQQFLRVLYLGAVDLGKDWVATLPGLLILMDYYDVDDALVRPCLGTLLRALPRLEVERMARLALDLLHLPQARHAAWAWENFKELDFDVTT